MYEAAVVILSRVKKASGLAIEHLPWVNRRAKALGPRHYGGFGSRPRLPDVHTCAAKVRRRRRKRAGVVRWLTIFPAAVRRLTVSAYYAVREQRGIEMPKQNTRLETEGAEFLVLGRLLVEAFRHTKCVQTCWATMFLWSIRRPPAGGNEHNRLRQREGDSGAIGRSALEF
jgi:hypothetical protein